MPQRHKAKPLVNIYFCVLVSWCRKYFAIRCKKNTIEQLTRVKRCWTSAAAPGYTLRAAMLTRPTGEAVGIDLTSEMLQRAEANLALTDLKNVTFKKAGGGDH
jgi:hypothetical protein